MSDDLSNQRTDLSPRQLDARLDVVLFGHGMIGAHTMRHDRLEYPHYSTTGDGMTLVLNEMVLEDPYLFYSLSREYNKNNEIKVRARFMGAKGSGEGEADALPRAVALAALTTAEKWNERRDE